MEDQPPRFGGVATGVGAPAGWCGGIFGREAETQEEKMAEQQRNPFRGFLDMASEMNRMRSIGAYGHEGGGEDRERTHANAWVPTADVFARVAAFLASPANGYVTGQAVLVDGGMVRAL
jgi:NAD(P)-dependent dehydrogenase (short-subunit alcohol dehydrogenase family)